MKTTRILTPEEIALNAGQNFPRLHLPTMQAFADRALRLRQLAAGHAMRDYLMLIAQLAEAQDRALQNMPDVPLPDEAWLAAAAQTGRPALLAHAPMSPPAPASADAAAAAHWPRDAAWQRVLHGMLDGLLQSLPAGSAPHAAAQAVRQWPADRLERQADRLLSGVMTGLDFAAAPFVAAGLQVYWTHLAIATQREHERRIAAAAPEAAAPNAAEPGGAAQDDAPRSAYGWASDATRCPCCGSLPTASITRIGSGSEGHRYLHCSLCGAQWHMVRVKCSHCQGTGGIHYQGLQKIDAQGGAPVPPPADAQGGESANAVQPVQAETCDSCGHYLKMMRMNRDPHLDAVADDLATVTLDLLVAESGMQRHGVNLMLLFGDAPADEESAVPAA